MKKYSIMVSVSIAEADRAVFEDVTHLISFEDAEMTEEEAKALKQSLVEALCGIRRTSTGMTVFGIYDADRPNGATLQ